MKASRRPKAIEFPDDGGFAVVSDALDNSPTTASFATLHLPVVATGGAAAMQGSSDNDRVSLRASRSGESQGQAAGVNVGDSALPTLTTIHRSAVPDGSDPGTLSQTVSNRVAPGEPIKASEHVHEDDLITQRSRDHHAQSLNPFQDDEEKVQVPGIDKDEMQTTDYNPVAGNSATPTAARVLPHAPTEAHASGAQSTPRFRMHLNFTSSSSKSITTARVDSEEAEEVAAGARILVPKGVVGLTNIGNTCFMNASLQCMLRIKPLVRYFNDGMYQSDLSVKSPTKGVVANSFASLLREIQEAGPGARITPSKFQKALFAFAPHLMDEEQQDCQEFLRFLLDGISDDLFRRSKQPKVASLSQPSQPPAGDNLVRQRSTGDNDVALMSKTFPLSLEGSPSTGSLKNIPRPKSSVARLRSMTSQAQVGNLDENDPLQLSSSSVANSPLPMRGPVIASIDSLHATRSIDRGDDIDRGECDGNSTPNRVLFSDNAVDESLSDKGVSSPVNKPQTEKAAEVKDEEKTTGNSEEKNIDSSQKYREKAQELAQQAWESHLNSNDSIITDLFAGQLQSTIQCLECNHRSFCFDPFLDLSVPIPVRCGECDPDKELPNESRASLWKRRLIAATGKKSQQSVDYPTKCSLEECIQAFSAEETLDGDNMIRCDKCDKRQKSSKKLAVYKCPEVLVFHIKRFQYTSVAREKLYTDVDFPLQGLDMKQFLSADVSEDISSKSFLYDLVSIVHHSGGINGGHYVANVTYPVKLSNPLQSNSQIATAASAPAPATGGDADDKKTMNASSSMSRFLPSIIFSSNFLGTGGGNETQGKAPVEPITRSNTEESHNDASVSFQTCTTTGVDAVPESREHHAWLCFNDDYISAVPERHIAGPSAYILFYQLRQ